MDWAKKDAPSVHYTFKLMESSVPAAVHDCAQRQGTGAQKEGRTKFGVHINAAHSI